ncbi:MAG: alpha-amylase [Streptococcaceae bacterium]|jgi:alpha-amylase|nr:alpha-amylase [Streptococcaceae bacterium]
MKLILQAFEWYLPADAKHWENLTKLTPKIKELGISGVWLPPASKGAAGINDVGYGIYDFYDLGEFDQKGTVSTKYGTKEEYIKLVESLQAQGIEAYADIVFDHMMGADESETVKAVQYNFSNRLQPESGVEDVEVWTKFTFPGRAGKYNDYIWTAKNFSGVDYDQRSKEHAIFAIQGQKWSPQVDDENGNFDYLMGANLDMSVPETVEQLEKWGHWFTDNVKIDGFRLDAVKHIDFHYFKTWLMNRQKQMGKDADLFVVGEYWSDEIGKLTNYLDESGNVLNLFDVPLHFNLYRASSSDGAFDMRDIFAGTLTDVRPDYAVTFVDNHDTQEGQALQSWVQGWFKEQAYALILLRKAGVPVVFWGDLMGIPSRKVGAVGTGLENMMKLRSQFEMKQQSDYLDHPDVIGWTALGDFDQEETGLAVILTNSKGGSKWMTIGAGQAHKVYVDLLGHNKDNIILNDEGRAEFPVNDGTVSIWIAQEIAAELLSSANDESENFLRNNKK